MQPKDWQAKFGAYLRRRPRPKSALRIAPMNLFSPAATGCLTV